MPCGMYIDRVPNRNSPPAILLRESYRVGSKVRKRTLANLSALPPSANAAAVVRYAASAGVEFPDAGELRSLTARGVRSSVAGEVVEIGSLRLWEEDGVAIPPDVREATERLQAGGRSVVVVRHGARWLGVLGVADRTRAEPGRSWTD